MCPDAFVCCIALGRTEMFWLVLVLDARGGGQNGRMTVRGTVKGVGGGNVWIESCGNQIWSDAGLTEGWRWKRLCFAARRRR